LTIGAKRLMQRPPHARAMETFLPVDGKSIVCAAGAYQPVDIFDPANQSLDPRPARAPERFHQLFQPVHHFGDGIVVALGTMTACFARKHRSETVYNLSAENR